jgi:helix-hairpin-helix protein
MSPFVVRFQDDQTFEQARDVLTGLEFIATLQIRTPLTILQHHGEFHPGPPSAAPRYSSIADGFWSYKTKSWSELAGRPLAIPDEPESTQASDIGPVTASQYLPFLKQFRMIVENGESVEKRLSQLAQLRGRSPQFEDIWCRLEKGYPDFPASFFYMQLAVVPGIGAVLARRLFEQGFVDLATLQSATEDQLKQVPGVGSKLAKRIREFESK